MEPDAQATARLNEVTNDQARGAITALVDAFGQLAETGRLAVNPDKEHLVQSVFGWWAWITRSSKLVLLAHDAGLGHEAAPNVRSILEHTLVMQWVADLGDEAMAAVGAKADESSRKLFNDLRDQHWSIPEDFNPSKSPTQAMLDFSSLCTAYGAHNFYIAYRMLSAHIHPTAQGAAVHVDRTTDVLHSHATRSADADLVLVAVCVIHAALTINSLAVEQPLTEAITLARNHIGHNIERPVLHNRT
ncbi:hypothetical protein SAMN05216174_103306 [Actinokineospora iranica]|uniref:Uncharacterized protein n=2 Tax=Actinokineospora iranica TaxID=1271860 RepID=A0A1G6NDG5_9PSEU|nr:hypothetical protein SAMN05216174_103306 [Actinokineospora iranica]